MGTRTGRGLMGYQFQTHGEKTTGKKMDMNVKRDLDFWINASLCESVSLCQLEQAKVALEIFVILQKRLLKRY